MIVIGKHVELNHEYEYRSVIELEGIASNYIKIPSSVILDTELRSNRVAVFSYLSLYKGIHSRLFVSVPSLLEWTGYKHDPRKGGTNDKFVETLDGLNDRGYLTFMGDLTRTACIEMEFDTQKVFDICFHESFAILYADEIEKIMKYRNANKKDTQLNNVNVLLVFAYLRNVIFRIPNKLKPENRNPEGIKQRREACIEAYATNYKDIAEEIGLSERTVSKAVSVLQELKLIVVDECFRIRTEDGEFRTPYTLFANYEKRDGKYLLTSGLDYARGEMERKAKAIRQYNQFYRINKGKRNSMYYF